LRRVLLNVVNNALEAMEGRAGELRVATAAEEREVVITVADQVRGWKTWSGSSSPITRPR